MVDPQGYQGQVCTLDIRSEGPPSGSMRIVGVRSCLLVFPRNAFLRWARRSAARRRATSYDGGRSEAVEPDPEARRATASSAIWISRSMALGS